MDNLIMYPMTFACLKKEDGRTTSFIWADSSGIIIMVLGEEEPNNWIGVDHTVALNKMKKLGWVEDSRGQVEK